MSMPRTDTPTDSLSRQPVGETLPHRTGHGSTATGDTGGANTEILGIAGVAVVAMALLAGGYAWRKSDTTTTTTAQPSNMSAPATTGQARPASPAAATEPMSQQNKPRTNPAEISTPPTQYEQGSGSATTPPASAPATAR